jgi:RNA polymerase sigma-70 factor (ECF subfamily)
MRGVALDCKKTAVFSAFSSYLAGLRNANPKLFLPGKRARWQNLPTRRERIEKEFSLRREDRRFALVFQGMTTTISNCRAGWISHPRGLKPLGLGSFGTCQFWARQRKSSGMETPRDQATVTNHATTERAVVAPSAMQALDRTWYHQTYQEYSGLVYAFVKSRVKSSAAADDLTQQIWLKVWTQAAKQFDGSNFRAWVLQIARTTIIDGFRKTKTHQSTAEIDVPERPQEAGPDEDLTTALRECLETISAEFSTVVRARMLGQPYDEICAQLSIPLGTAHSRLDKGKKQLKLCVEGKMS